VVKPEKPHVVFVMADDLGSNDVGYSDPTIISPEIDELATKGVRLSTCITWNWCAPSRGAMLSGRYAPNTGFEGSADGGTRSGKGNLAVMPLKYPLLAQVLKPAGYFTVMAGKWCVTHTFAHRLRHGQRRALSRC